MTVFGKFVYLYKKYKLEGNATELYLYLESDLVRSRLRSLFNDPYLFGDIEVFYSQLKKEVMK